MEQNQNYSLPLAVLIVALIYLAIVMYFELFLNNPEYYREQFEIRHLESGRN